MRGDEQQPAGTPDEEPDTEGHLFKWEATEDAKGRKRLRQTWDPDSPPPGAPQRPTTPEQPKGR
jgi:hypothetical protein